jgi:predicted RNA-binding Zn ribbon-like protein
MSISASHFALLGGVMCLDFANTKNWNEAEKPYDFFWEYPALLSWALQLGLLTQCEAEAQFELSRRQESEAQAALSRAVSLREAIYAAFSALDGGQVVPAGALETINGTWADAMSHMRVFPEGEKFAWKWVGADRVLDSVLWPVAKSVAELLVSEKLKRVKCCGGCGWLFLDTTRDSRRRWCDMKICGNRAKARRHYERVSG